MGTAAGGDADMTRARDAYRSLQKAVRKYVSAKDGNDLWARYISQQFREAARDSDAGRTEELLSLAEDYAFLVKSVHGQKVQMFAGNLCQPLSHLAPAPNTRISN